MGEEIIAALMNGGAGLGGGGVLGAVLAKYLVNKAEREVRSIKKELAQKQGYGLSKRYRNTAT